MNGLARATRLAAPLDESDHQRGWTTAPVVLVEYGDYECPRSASAHPTIQELRQRAGDRLCFVFRHFPQSHLHSRARRAAEAAEAAGAQGRFWPMHDLLFANPDALADDDLIEYAARVGLDVSRFFRELAGHHHAERLRADLESGALSGVLHTPTFFVNGARHLGPHDLTTLLAIVAQTALRSAGREALSATGR